MNREKAIEYWEGLRKTFSSQLEQEENHFGRMHLQTTIDAIDMAISALRQQDVADKDVGKNEPLTNAQKIRAMSDEELMKLHYSGSAHCIADDPTVCDRHDFIGNLTPCEQCYLKWLQQPADGEEDKNDV